MRYLNTLGSVAWGMRHFGGIVTGGKLRRRDMLAAEKQGFVRSIGDVPLCDDDGFTIDPERYREGWELTEAGMEYLRKHDPETYDIHLRHLDNSDSQTSVG